MSQGPVLIIDHRGVYPDNLDQAIEEQRSKPMDTSKMVFVFGS